MAEHNESKTLEPSATGRRNLLSTNISAMPLAIPDSHLEGVIDRLYGELDSAGINFKPETYLSDSWGCPSGVPVIGIPFYLADAGVYRVVNEFIDAAPWEEAEIIKYLRHESGHALNYAYRLYQDPAWERTFGKYSKTYKDNYKSVPFDTHFVRHSAGWYAQKHPDEDFAETFAVWLAPDSHWGEVYAGTPALAKLLYVDSIAKVLRQKQAEITGGKLDRLLSELDTTLHAWCRFMQTYGRKKIALPRIIDTDLRRLFPDKGGTPAAEFLEANRRLLVRAVHDWTGVSHDILNSLVRELTKTVKALGLRIETDKRSECIANITAFMSALAMNYQHSSNFVTP